MRRRELTIRVTLANDLVGYRANAELARQLRAVLTLVDADVSYFRVPLHDAQRRRTGFALMREIVQ